MMPGSAGLRTDDPDLADAWFLYWHPAWTYRDLAETPEYILQLIQLIGRSGPRNG